MLILTRKSGESIYIGDDIKITVVELKGNQIRIGIDAPSSKKIYREEIYLQILEENKEAAQSMGDGDLSSLDTVKSFRKSTNATKLKVGSINKHIKKDKKK